MSEHFHAIAWIDHREAKIFHFNAEEVERESVRAHGAGRHVQHKANVTGAGHKGIDRSYFADVATALDHTGAILLAGPGNAKLEFRHYLEQEHPHLLARVSGVEPLDHPTEPQLVALARRFFRADDRMHAQVH